VLFLLFGAVLLLLSSPARTSQGCPRAASSVERAALRQRWRHAPWCAQLLIESLRSPRWERLPDRARWWLVQLMKRLDQRISSAD
jgi:hypothetical protein